MHPNQEQFQPLAMLDAIEAAINDLVSQAGDKSLLVWWRETDAISRGDAQWQQIEAAIGAKAAGDLFAALGAGAIKARSAPASMFEAAPRSAPPTAATPTMWQRTVAKTKSMLGISA